MVTHCAPEEVSWEGQGGEGTLWHLFIPLLASRHDPELGNFIFRTMPQRLVLAGGQVGSIASLVVRIYEPYRTCNVTPLKTSFTDSLLCCSVPNLILRNS